MSELTYAPSPVLSVSPVTLRAPGRPVDLQVRVAGTKLPFILLSHGHGNSNHLSSLDGYGPLASYWAARGFGVLQPTHLDAKVLGLRDADDAEAPLYWRSRAQDMTRILDQLDAIEAAVPGAAWHADPYLLSPGPKALLTAFGAGHGLGGVAGWDAAETTDEDPARVAAVAELSLAYLRSSLYLGDDAWQSACAALTSGADAVGRAESK
jgi:predicted dienelactone hydrolase